MTKLDKPLRREVQIGDKAYTLTIAPEGLKLVEKGHRKGTDIAWTGLPMFQRMEPHRIRYVYFGFLLTYFVLGLTFLVFVAGLGTGGVFREFLVSPLLVLCGDVLLGLGGTPFI